MLFAQITEALGLQPGPRAGEAAREITQLALLDEDTFTFQEDTLYFGLSSQLSGRAQLPAQCILAEDCPPPARLFEVDYAFVEQGRLFSSFNRAFTILQETADRERLYHDLVSRGKEAKSLDAFINAAAAKLGNAVILLDLSFQILAYSTIYQINDTLWAENIRRGYCSYEFISAIMDLDSIKNAPHTQEAVEVTCITSPYKKLSSRIYANGVRIGTVLMLEKDTPVCPAHMEYMQIISRAAGEVLACVAPHHLSQTNQYQRLLYDLLIGATPADVNRRILDMRLPARMCALAIKPTRYLSQRHLHEHVAAALQSQFQGFQVTAYQDGLAVLAPLGTATKLPEETIKRLEQLCAAEHIRAGVSNVFESIVDFAKYYEQAAKALVIDTRLRQDSAVCQYVYSSFHDLLDLTQADDNGPGRFCHPALGILSRYDHKNGTEFYHTLKTHLFCSCNNKETSARLFIHRNTLTYRLDKIVELTGIDLADSYVRFLLFMSFEIDRHSWQDFLSTADSAASQASGE